MLSDHHLFPSQRKEKRSADAVLRVNPNLAAVPFDDLLHDRQPDAGAAAELVAGVQSLENLKDRLVKLLRNADAVVAHVKRPSDDRYPSIAAGGSCSAREFRRIADLDPRVGLVVVLHRVGDQVAKHLAEPDPIAMDRRQRSRDAELDLPLVEHDPQRVDDFRHELVEVGLPNCEVLPADARELQQRIEEHVHPLRQPLERLQLRGAVFVELVLVVFQQERRVVVNAAQRLLQVVRGDVGELVQLLVAAEQLLIAPLNFVGVEQQLLLGLLAVA